MTNLRANLIFAAVTATLTTAIVGPAIYAQSRPQSEWTCTETPDYFIAGPNAGRAAIYRECKSLGYQVSAKARLAD